MSDDIRIEQLPERQRFIVSLGGEHAALAQAGLIQYVEHGDQRVFLHTVIDDRYERRGLGSALVRSALDTTREQGKRIVPVCTFVRRYLRDHPDWDDIVEAPTPGLLDSLPD